MRLLAAPATVAATLVVVQWAGAPDGNGGGLPTPPLTGPGRWQQWLTEHGALVTAFGLIRVAAVVVAWYVLATMVVGLVARAASVPRLVRAADRVTLPSLKRFMATVVAAGVTGSQLGAMAFTPAPAVAAAASATQSSTTALDQPAGESTPATIVMRRITGEPGPMPAPSAPPISSGTDVAAPSVIHTPPASAPDTWTVQPGQCFWTIAAKVLAARWGRPPTDAEIVPYWLRLIEVNRTSLADPANADLIFPAQIFTVPPPS